MVPTGSRTLKVFLSRVRRVAASGMSRSSLFSLNLDMSMFNTSITS